MLTRLNTATGTFNNFVKLFWPGPTPKHRQKNSFLLPDHWNLANFWEILLRGTEKDKLLRSMLHSKQPCSRRNIRQCRPSISQCLQGWICWDFIIYDEVLLEIAQKLFLGGYYFLDSSFLQHVQNFLFH